MGVLADAVLAGGGKAIGVIPQSLVDRELAHGNLTELHIVNTMHERKALMADLSDAFVALPGGYGTGDELFEILTWAQLGMHTKPIGLLNIAGYFEPMLAWLDLMVREGIFCSASLSRLAARRRRQRGIAEAAGNVPPRSGGAEMWISDAER